MADLDTLVVLTEPEPRSPQQGLFRASISRLVDELRIRLVDLERLHEAGILSARPAPDLEVDAGVEQEIRFLGALLNAGCDLPMMRGMLASLPKPYAYDPARTLYDFHAQAWRSVERVGPEEVVDHAIEALSSDLPASAVARLAHAAVTTLAAQADGTSSEE